MKKFLILTLAVLMLCGCAPGAPEPTAATVPTEAPTEEAVISHESVETLEFDYEDVFTAAPMGDDLLLLSGMDQTTLIKMSGRNHKKLAAYSAETAVYPGAPGVQISENGVCYAVEKEYIFLNENLEETERITLPDAWGRGVVTADLQTIYYSTGSELRAYNRQTGLDRLLRNTMHTTLALESLEVNDTVLVCSLLDYSAVSPTLFYSTATGELMDTYDRSITLSSAGDLWLAKTSDGCRNQIVFGCDESQVLTGWESFSDVTLIDGGILIHSPGSIRFINPADSTEAAIVLEEDALVMNAWNAGGILWIALDDGRLLRWELEDTETQAVSCIVPYYTRENPDTEGLAALEPIIAELENTYGVSIHIFEDAVAVRHDTMTLTSEYQADILAAGLEELSQALSRFTTEFLGSVGRASSDGKVHICLVRSVTGNGCFQFWDEAGVARIALTVDENLQTNLYHGLGHMIDSRVLSKCTAFDGWKNLNPQDFQYDYDYLNHHDPGEFPGAFTDPLAMTSPVEDRASVFAQAILEDTEEIFASEILQKKLSTLCAGIRKAFGLKNSDEILPWEQHLA